MKQGKIESEKSIKDGAMMSTPKSKLRKEINITGFSHKSKEGNKQNIVIKPKVQQNRNSAYSKNDLHGFRDINDTDQSMKSLLSNKKNTGIFNIR